MVCIVTCTVYTQYICDQFAMDIDEALICDANSPTRAEWRNLMTSIQDQDQEVLFNLRN